MLFAFLLFTTSYSSRSRQMRKPQLEGTKLGKLSFLNRNSSKKRFMKIEMGKLAACQDWPCCISALRTIIDNSLFEMHAHLIPLDYLRI